MNQEASHPNDQLLFEYSEGTLAPDRLAGLEQLMAGDPAQRAEADLWTRSRLSDPSGVAFPVGTIVKPHWAASWLGVKVLGAVVAAIAVTWMLLPGQEDTESISAPEKAGVEVEAIQHPESSQPETPVTETREVNLEGQSNLNRKSSEEPEASSPQLAVPSNSPAPALSVMSMTAPDQVVLKQPQRLPPQLNHRPNQFPKMDHRPPPEDMIWGQPGG